MLFFQIALKLTTQDTLSLTDFNTELRKGNIRKASEIIQTLYENTKSSDNKREEKNTKDSPETNTSDNIPNKTRIIETTYASFLLKTGDYKKIISLFGTNPATSSTVALAKIYLTKLNEKNYKVLLNTSPFSTEILKSYAQDCLQKGLISEADKILVKSPSEFKAIRWFKELTLASALLKLDFKEEQRKMMSSLLVPTNYIKAYERNYNRAMNVLLGKNQNEDTFKLKEFTNKLENLSKDNKQLLFNINVYRVLYLKMLDILLKNHKFPEYGAFVKKIVDETGDMSYRKAHVRYIVSKNQNEEALQLLGEYKITDPTFKKEIQENINMEHNKLKAAREKEIKERKSKNPQDSQGFYKVLGCNPWDPQEVIKESYREKLKKMKEIKDTKQKDEETMKLTQAFDALKSEAVRAEYDKKTKENFYEGRGGYSRRESYGHDDYDDLFANFFGGGGGRRSQRSGQRTYTTFRFG